MSSEHTSTHEAPLPPDTRPPTLTSVIANHVGEKEAEDYLAGANAALPPVGKVSELFNHRWVGVVVRVFSFLFWCGIFFFFFHASRLF